MEQQLLTLPHGATASGTASWGNSFWHCLMEQRLLALPHGETASGTALWSNSFWHWDMSYISLACVLILQRKRYRHTEVLLLHSRCKTNLAQKNVIFWDIETQLIPRRRHITSPLQSPAS
jgi:hypothetical protein